MLAMHSKALAADGLMPPDNWFVDNGATCHLTFRRHILSYFKLFSELKNLQAADENRVEAVGAGTAYLKAAVSGQQHIVELNNVWYVPKLNRNFSSVLAEQDKNENSVFISTSRICNLHVDDKKMLVGIRGLFRLVASTVLPAKPEVNMISDIDMLQLYHEQMGHQNKRHVSEVIEREFGIKASASYDTCEGCMYDKAHRLMYGTRKHATTAGQLIHADECGPTVQLKYRRLGVIVILFCLKMTTQSIAIYIS
jgi:hypothetical protein